MRSKPVELVEEDRGVGDAESLEHVPQNLVEVQPTIFFGVPRIWEKFYAKIQHDKEDNKFHEMS